MHKPLCAVTCCTRVFDGETRSFDGRFLKQFMGVFYWGFHYYHGTLVKYVTFGIHFGVACACFSGKRFSTLTEAFIIEFERGKDQAG